MVKLLKIVKVSFFFYAFFMDRTIKVIGEKEEKARILLVPIEKAGREKAYSNYDVSTPLYNGIFFVHMKNKRKLGSFIFQERIIILSEELLDYPFSTLTNVFIHECGHAVDFFLNGCTTGHSSFFREICLTLGIDPGFEKARVKKDLLNKEKAKSKVEKLLRMTESSFENEAMIALNKARELIEKERLNSSNDAKEEKIYYVDAYNALRIPTYITYIAHIVSDNTATFFIKDCKRDYNSLTFYGTVEQCENVLYLFDYLTQILDDEVKRQRKNGVRITKDSFMVGAYQALKKRSESSNNTAIVKSIKEETKEKALRIVFKNTHLSSSKRRIHIDPNSYKRGSNFASTLDLNKNKQKKLK